MATRQPWQGLVRLAAPLDFERSARLARASPAAAWDGREYRRVLDWRGRPALLCLRQQGTVQRPALAWRLVTGRAGAEPPGADMVVLIERLVAAAPPLEACYAAFQHDVVLAGLAERGYGLRPFRAPSLYESLLGALLERRDAAARQRFLEALGPVVALDGRHHHGYPPPATLAAAPPAALAGFDPRQERALRALAAAAAAWEEAAWTAQPLEAARIRLLALPGIGAATAEWALLTGLGHTDALPAEDAALRRAVQWQYGLRTPVTAPALRRRWRRLEPWRGWAAWYVLAAGGSGENWVE